MGIADTDPTPICCLILASKVIRYRREGQAASSIPGTGLYNRAYYGVSKPIAQNTVPLPGVIAAAAGTVDFTQYNRIAIAYPATSCTFGGLGNIGCQGASSTINHQYSVVWLHGIVTTPGTGNALLLEASETVAPRQPLARWHTPRRSR
jgi:hypothetical protein